MKSIAIECTPRDITGRTNAKKLRKDEAVPCVLYGGESTVHFSAPARSFKNLVYTPSVYTVDLNIGGSQRKAIMKDIQFHPVSDAIMHIDFLELDSNKPVIIDIPVQTEGSAIGVRQGGKLHIKVRTLKVSALPADLPDSITVNIENLNIGKAIKVSNIQLKGAVILDKPNTVVCQVKVTREVAPEEPAAPAAGEEAKEGAEGEGEAAAEKKEE
jgi:large subunit ribosomal protein L25